MLRFPLLALLALCLGLSACASSPNVDVPMLTSVATQEVRPATNLPPYRVQIGDVLDLKFQLNPELDETVTVRPDGMISTAMYSDIPVYNRTITEINENLHWLYRTVLTTPRVSTIVRSFAPTRIYVSGEVNAPGEFVVVGPSLTLTQAIARAGGVLNSAQSDKVLVLRRGAAEKTDVFMANYKAATQGGDGAQDVRLAPYDVVFVPKTGIALTHKTYQQYIQQFITPSLGVGATFDLNN